MRKQRDTAAIQSSQSPAAPEPTRLTDLLGAVQLAAQATVGMSGVVEGVHRSVWNVLGIGRNAAPGRTTGITGFVYGNVRRTAWLVGRTAEITLANLQPAAPPPTSSLDDQPATAVTTPAPSNSDPQRLAARAALNGVIGDRLAADGSPLAIPMTVRYQGRALGKRFQPPAGAVTGKVLLLIHGLCMNDLQWARPHDGQIVDHGATLAELGYTPLYLRYNSGRHVSQNGRELAVQLERVLAQWPVPVEELSVVAHSMGGLVMRSACHYAQQDGLQWPNVLKKIVFLGTPHHGAPLERAGNWVDAALKRLPAITPLAAIGQVRSAGITDLRYGHVLEDDWHQHDRFHRHGDTRQIVPLPDGVACFTAAATTAAQRSALSDHLIGDGLVPLRSALGQHGDPQRCLAFAPNAQWVAHRTSHMALLSAPDVTQQLLHWLKPTASL